MSRDQLFEQLTSNPNLPTPSSTALRVLEQANHPHCTLQEISRIIGHDPALCGKILKMVNSAVFGMPRAVTSLDRALHLLGLRRVRSLVLSLSLPTLQVRTSANPRMRDYWKASLASAVVAGELARQLRLPDPDSEQVTALLSDLGMLILQEVYPEQYLEVIACPPEVLARGQCDVEEKVLGLNHAEVGSFLLKRWHMPEEIHVPVLYHHQPDKAPAAHGRRAMLLHFAGLVAQLQVGAGQSSLIGDIISLAWSQYRMNDQQLSDFLTPLTEKIQQFAAILQLDIGTCKHFPALFADAIENLTRLAVETSLDNVRVSEEKSHAQAELKKVEAELEKTEEKLRQAMKLEAIGRLAGGVAHDFNNLLTVINGCCELLMMQTSQPSAQRSMLEEIHKAGVRATDLTRQLLAFGRKQILVPAVLNINQVVQSLEKMLRRLIGEDIQLVAVLAPDLPLVKVDPGQLDQVIINLAVNARDAMPNGGRLTIETRLTELDRSYCAAAGDVAPGAYIQIALSDTGCGMTDAVRQRVFEPFFTTKGAGGTGLGLATVHGIAKQSGGHVSVYSELGVGTTFKVYLPIAASDAVATPVQNVATPSVPRGHETILLVEDDKSVRTVARQMLEASGYRVLEANDGHEALHIGEELKEPIHVLITDTIMPHMGGCELGQRLMQSRPVIKVLYMSGYTDDAIFRHGVLNSRSPFLQKPFTPQALVAKVHDLLHAADTVK